MTVTQDTFMQALREALPDLSPQEEDYARHMSLVVMQQVGVTCCTEKSNRMPYTTTRLQPEAPAHRTVSVSHRLSFMIRVSDWKISRQAWWVPAVVGCCGVGTQRNPATAGPRMLGYQVHVRHHSSPSTLRLVGLQRHTAQAAKHLDP